MSASETRVVLADPLTSDAIELMSHDLSVIEALDAGVLDVEITTAHALVVRSRTKVTNSLLDRGQSLRLVARAGIGVDNVDVDAATQRGILVINAPLGSVRSTAEHTIAMVFGLVRRIPAADRAVRDGTWKTGYEGFQLLGKRLGIVGLGKVGRQVAAMASAIGMQVVAHDPYLPPGAWADLPYPHLTLDEVLGTSDVVTLHVPLLAATYHLIGQQQLSMMRPGSYLINCARGGLVDESALALTLEHGHLAGAALDVYREEPLSRGPLLNAPNLILTPHIAASTREAQSQVSSDIATQILDFFAGRPVAFPVNPTVLEEAL